MTDRMYDNGMLLSGEARHCNKWEYPTMPRLQREEPSACCQNIRQNFDARKRGYVAILIDVLRAR
ncbi:MAG TPA: hypothetical protein PKI32_05940 [Opitutales bacterium]|mgnify:CR=1 FL=1|nr:hypothetical protein [Opitutales bacterium]